VASIARTDSLSAEVCAIVAAPAGETTRRPADAEIRSGMQSFEACPSPMSHITIEHLHGAASRVLKTKWDPDNSFHKNVNVLPQ
jgi:hypothetical protein